MPFVSPTHEGKVMRRDGVKALNVKPGYLKPGYLNPKRTITPAELGLCSGVIPARRL